MVLKFRKKALEKFGDMKLLANLMPNVSLSRYKWKFSLAMVAMFSLIIGIANPQIGSELETVKRKGVEVIIALDVSNSMMAEDINPNRLTRAKRAISKLIDELTGNNIGLIVFAGEAYVQLPVTSDYASAKMFLATINTDIVNAQGTAIGSAIELAEASFTKENDKNKALIIITDGENHEDDAIKLAEEVQKKGIFVNTIGLGSLKGTPIPIVDRLGRKDYRRDNEGKVVMTKLNEDLLVKIAAAGGGEYVHAGNSNFGLNSIISSINGMDKQEFESKVFSDYEDRFQYFIGFAILLLLIEMILLERKNKFTKGINIFKV